MWRVRTDQELKVIHKDLDIVAGLKKKERLDWSEHFVRMDQGRID